MERLGQFGAGECPWRARLQIQRRRPPMFLPGKPAERILPRAWRHLRQHLPHRALGAAGWRNGF